MWVSRGGPVDHPYVVYQYRPSRSSEMVKEFIGDYRGYVQTDGYGVYDFLKTKKGFIHAGCWIHAHRMFVAVIEARKSNEKTRNQKVGSGEITINYIRKLYAIEKYADDNEFSVEQRYVIRQEQALCWMPSKSGWRKEAFKPLPKACLARR
ncbi:conserved hypothetical protein [uncultured Desulfobacterium sp.]|uniref:Transposase IS66 central domain-containing protein n=1 Tax=uncultured Desulfobacterium sp. TaxID=201089 RepID=A0A445MXH1_9BACT|nr:conserved hypothetical protein [uncultured Desulfobacterium sp.]